MTPGPAPELLHATTVALDGRAVVIAGYSGSGKSDLALRLLDRGFLLVSDDQTWVRIAEGRLIASAPSTIKGKLEVRGIGIVEVETVDEVPVCLLVTLGDAIERLPEEGRSATVLGVEIPLVTIDATIASAPAKVTIALDRLGLKS